MTKRVGSARRAVNSSGVRANTRGTRVSLAVSRMRATKNRSRTTAITAASTLVILLADPQPVLVPLGDVAEGPEVAHAVDVDDAVQMVGLVLDHAGEELLGVHDLPVALAVVVLQAHRRVARHHPPHVGHRETPFPAVLHLVGERRHHRVDDDRQRDDGRLGIAWVALDLDDGDLGQLVHLVAGQAGPVVLVHGLDHVVDEPLEGRRADRLDGHRLRLHAQHRMPQPGDFQDGHIERNSTMRVTPYFLSSTLPTLRTPAARRLASASKKRWNSSPCLKAMGVSSLSMAALKSASATAALSVSRSLASTGSGVPLGANTPAQM